MEDHGYAVDLGIPEVTGFLPFKNSKMHDSDGKHLPVGGLVDVVVDKLGPDGRTCMLSANPSSLRTSLVSIVDLMTICTANHAAYSEKSLQALPHYCPGRLYLPSSLRPPHQG